MTILATVTCSKSTPNGRIGDDALQHCMSRIVDLGPGRYQGKRYKVQHFETGRDWGQEIAPRLYLADESLATSLRSAYRRLVVQYNERLGDIRTSHFHAAMKHRLDPDER